VVREDVDIDPNPNEIAETRWVGLDELNSMAIAHSRLELVIAPWFELIRRNFLDRLWVADDGFHAGNETVIKHL
jgi:isopentenyldiphosphate isomerase